MFNNNCFFSIIIPVFNTEDYLDDCINSVLEQTFSDWEIILIDDGSTDKSIDICNKYRVMFPNKIFVYYNNRQNPQSASGVLYSRLYGIEHSHGEYLVFVDSDDMLRYDALQNLFRSITEKQADMIVYNASTDINYLKAYRPSIPNRDNAIEKIVAQYILISSWDMNSVWSKCVKRVTLEKIPSLENFYDLCRSEDLLLSLHMVNLVNKIAYCDQCLYFYRKRIGSITNSHYSYYDFCSEYRVQIERDKFAKLWSIEDGCDFILEVSISALDVIYYGIKHFMINNTLVDSFRLIKNTSLDKHFSSWFSCAIHSVSFHKKIVMFLIKNRCYFGLFLIRLLFLLYK